MDTFPSPVIPQTTVTKFSRPEERGSAFLRSIRIKFLSKVTQQLAVILTVAVHSVVPVSNLNTETGYTDFRVSVVLFRISKKIPGFALIKP